MADQKKKKQKQADKSLRDEVAEVVSEEERRRILAEQAPRVAEAKARVAAQPPPQAQPVAVETPVQSPADKPLSPDETGGIVNALRNHEPFKTMHALITKNARTADKTLKQAE
jgi:hypothetical protein